MSSQSTDKTCGSCHKTQAELSIPLKHCARCKTQSYCSPECQKADWKSHKSLCKVPDSSGTSNPTPSTTSSNSDIHVTIDPSQGLCYISYPFTAIQNGTWLYNRPEKDVYALLIDTYRLRIEDDYKFTGAIKEGSFYSGASRAEAIGCFCRFLRNIIKLDAERTKKFLPQWWSQDKFRGCLTFACNDDWSDITSAIEEHDIVEHYKQPSLPMQLRMFGEKADGTLTAGTSGEEMLHFQIKAEMTRLAHHFSMMDISR